MHLEEASYSPRTAWQYWGVAVLTVLLWSQFRDAPYDGQMSASVEYLRTHAGLGRGSRPAKQYRMQLHVTTNAAHQWRAAKDARYETET